MSNGQVLWALLPWLAPHRGTLAKAGLLMLTCTGLFQVGPLLIRRAVDHDMGHRDLQGLYLTVALYAGAQALLVWFGYLERMLLETTGLRIMTALKQRVFDRVLELSLSFFDKHSAGRLMSRVESDCEALRLLLSFTAVILVGDSLKLAASLALMYCIHPGLFMVVGAVLVLLITMSLAFGRIGRPIYRKIRERNADVSTFLTERLQAVSVIQAYTQEERTSQDMDRLNADKFRVGMRGNFLWNTFFNLIILVEAGGVCLALAYGGRLVMQGLVTIGTVLMFTDFLRRFFEPVFRLSEQLSVIQRSLAAGERVFDLLGQAAEVADPAVGKPWSGLQQGIEFDSVTFAYRDNEPVIQDVSFYLPRGQRWAIVGLTGGGKSTLISLLLRFYDPQQGAIRVDGIDLRDMKQDELRRHCALVLQDIVIFPGSVRDNIALGDRQASDRAVRHAARVAAADSFIERLPDQYETALSERGANLSTGQRQLLSFARALARQPELLILDEATASVDPETERTVQAALHKVLEGRTALIVAHRLSTIRDAHQILVVEHGRIVEQGTHDELLSRGGAYSRLHRLQMAATDVPEERGANAA